MPTGSVGQITFDTQTHLFRGENGNGHLGSEQTSNDNLLCLHNLTDAEAGLGTLLGRTITLGSGSSTHAYKIIGKGDDYFVARTCGNEIIHIPNDLSWKKVWISDLPKDSLGELEKDMGTTLEGLTIRVRNTTFQFSQQLPVKLESTNSTNLFFVKEKIGSEFKLLNLETGEEISVNEYSLSSWVSKINQTELKGILAPEAYEQYLINAYEALRFKVSKLESDVSKLVQIISSLKSGPVMNIKESLDSCRAQLQLFNERLAPISIELQNIRIERLEEVRLKAEREKVNKDKIISVFNKVISKSIIEASQLYGVGYTYINGADKLFSKGIINIKDVGAAHIIGFKKEKQGLTPILFLNNQEILLTDLELGKVQITTQLIDYGYYKEGDLTVIDLPLSCTENIKHSQRIISLMDPETGNVIKIHNASGLSWVPNGKPDRILLKVRKPSAITLNLPDLLPRNLNGDVIEI